MWRVAESTPARQCQAVAGGEQRAERKISKLKALRSMLKVEVRC